jgi:signal transduction histidine kinase
MRRPITSSPSSSGNADYVPLSRSEVLAIFAFWTFLALLQAANAVLDPRGRGVEAAITSVPVLLQFAESYLWAALTPVIFWLGGRYGTERANIAARLVLFLGVGILLAMGVEMLLAYLRSELLPLTGRRIFMRFRPLFGVSRLLWLDDLMVYFAVLAAAFARSYFLRYRARQEEAARLQAHAALLQAELTEARLSALQSQLNPHFLFNTLHAVSSLVERDPRGVRKMIARLSELLRFTLERTEQQEISLAQEMAFLERYLEIMQIRFQGKLEVDTKIDPVVSEALVPTLILQPLVENAVKHGVSKVDAMGRITIAARREGERLVLSVQDNGPGLNGAAATEEGIGLRNTRARLEQLYGTAQSLTLRDAAHGGLVAEVTLPFHTGDDLLTHAVTES